MANMLDYLDWRGDVPFSADPFNENDALVLAELGYVPLEHTVPESFHVRIRLRDAAQRFRKDAVGDFDRIYSFDTDCELLQKMAHSVRFGNTQLTGYINRIDNDELLQFSALTCLLEDGTTFVSYRGTDGSLVGWKEDLAFSYLVRTPAQNYAVEYLNGFFTAHPRPIRIGGHSKGGNLSMYAASFCSPDIRSRITEVYSFDGPGFRDEIVDSPEYQSMIPKIRSFIPESSFVGMLLATGLDHAVIRSNESGIKQHCAYTWELSRHGLLRADELSKNSMLINKVMNGWLADYDDEERRVFVQSVFDILGASDHDTFREINQNRRKSYPAMLKAVAALSPEQQGVLFDALKKIVRSGKDAIMKPDGEK